MEKTKPFLVIAATIGTILMNYLAAIAVFGGITPDYVSNKYPTFITPAGYAFSIWGWIYLGLIVFSVYQALPSQLERFREVRTLFIASCLANCAWIYVWHNQLITLSLLAILSLLALLAFINLRLQRENNFFARIVFGLYFGWVTVASVVNATIALIFNGASASDEVSIWIAVGLIVVATVIGIFLRHQLPNIAYPVAIAWAVTAIAVKQSGKTPIVVVSALAVIALLISALSFILKDQKILNEQR